MKKVKRHECGAALLVVLLISFVLLITIMPFLHKLSGEFRLTEKFYKTIAALYLAEAGVERAIWELNEGDISTWEGPGSERTLSIPSFLAADGSIIGDITVTIFDSTATNPIIESVGNVVFSGNIDVVRKVRVVLEKESMYSYFDHAVFGNNEVVLNEDILIDSYDSRLRDYGKKNKGANGDIGTNSTQSAHIDIGEETTVKGDAYVGFEGDPETIIRMDNDANITGNQLSLSETRPQISIPAPVGLPLRGDYDGSNTINQDGHYENFILGNNKRVTIQGDVTLYVSGSFYMQQNSQLRIWKNSSLTLFLDGSFTADKETKFNHLGGGKDPTKLLIFGTADFQGEIRFKEEVQFYGAVYAPTGEVYIEEKSKFYGALEASKVTLEKKIDFHYDEALKETISGGGSGVSFWVKSWQQITFTE
ncbi:MAG: hypothetical protein MUP98_16475 [Candidatus Aminicenantes bacterium]|nr:hypothetical protein [Candidatus Aminicenantes bacterium]